MKYLFLIFTLFLTPTVFAWNSVGHRIIAQIAYDQLTPVAKQQVDALTKINFHSPYPSARFLRAAVWPDQIKRKTSQYNTWHYINLPYVKNGVTPAAVNSENVVTEITRAEKIIEDKQNSPARRAEYLSFLIHFVGDIHQPLHCTTLYSSAFPHGDRGGNDYLIDSPIAKNLHQLWDRGLGLFVSSKNNYAFHYWQIEQIATRWMQEYPHSFFGAKLQEQSPMQWAQESHQIAIHFVYTLPENSAPQKEYLHQGKAIVREQSVLAGDRLATALNQIFP